MVRWLQRPRVEGEARPARRVWLTRVAAGAGAMVLFGMPLVALAAPEPLEGGAPPVPAQMADDDAGHAMFNIAAMAPGQRASRCVVVAYEGATATPVALRGNGGGRLGGYLDMVVEVGSGGGSSACSGFSGSELYRGTLAGFLNEYGDGTSGLTTWEASGDAPARTFRFTFALPDAAGATGKTATADFSWQVDVPLPEAPVPAEESLTPEAEPPAAAASGGVPETIDAAKPFEIGADESRAPEDALVIKPKVVAAGDAAAKAGKPVPATALGQLEEVVGKLISQAAEVAQPVLKRSAFPAALVAVVIGFIGVQNRIDRNDPKLALAPLNAEPDLPFDQ